MRPKITKKADSIKEAREMEKHLTAAGFDFEVYGEYTWKDKENRPIFASSGCEIRKIGYKYAEMKVDGEYMKATPIVENTKNSRDGCVVFRIYG